MRDLDQLVTALRDRADGLEPVALLPGVRRGAGRVRRRRQIAAVTAVVLAVAGVVGGAALTDRGHGNKSAPASPSTAPTPSIQPALASIIGKTWQVVGWNVAGKNGAPTLTSPPTLRFLPQHGQVGGAEVSVFDGLATTTRTVVVSQYEMTFLGRAADAAAATPGVVAADRALSAVLTGRVGWDVDEGRLDVRSEAGPDSLTLVSAPLLVAGSPAHALLGKTWHLTSVTRLGRTWAPDTKATLVFVTSVEAITDDSENTEQWRVELAPTTVSWVPGEESAVGATTAANAVSTGVSGVLVGTTAWSLSGSTLVLSGAQGGSLTYSTTAPPPPPPPGKVRVTMWARHGAGVRLIGKGPVSGIITIKGPDGDVLWTAQSPVLEGELPVPAGRYAATAHISDGICTPGSIAVPAGQTVTLVLSCRDGLSTD